MEKSTEAYPVKIMGGTLYHIQVLQQTFCDDVVDIFTIIDGEPDYKVVMEYLLDYYRRVYNLDKLTKEEKEDLRCNFTVVPVYVPESAIFMK